MEWVVFPDEIPDIGELVQFKLESKLIEARVRARWRDSNQRTFTILVDLEENFILSITPNSLDHGKVDRMEDVKPYWRLLSISSTFEQVPFCRQQDHW